MTKRYELVELDDPMFRLGADLPDAGRIIKGKFLGTGLGVRTADVTDLVGGLASAQIIELMRERLS